jgi:hypothetical protein
MTFLETGAYDELEGIFKVYFEPGEFGGRDGEGGGDRCQSLTVLIDVQRSQSGGREFDGSN